MSFLKDNDSFLDSQNGVRYNKKMTFQTRLDLIGLNLIEYSEAFEEDGCDDLDLLREMTDEEIENMLIKLKVKKEGKFITLKEGHKLKFMKSIKRLRPESPNEVNGVGNVM